VGIVALPRDSGSRTVFDILLQRRSDPTDDAHAAAKSKEGRIVTCHVRADFEPFPSRWRVGNLHLTESGVRWRKGIRARGGGEDVPQLTVRETRNVVGREALVIKRGLFQVIEADTERGRICLAVPTGSVNLVVRRLSQRA
jgi:hypothetical protein